MQEEDTDKAKFHQLVAASLRDAFDAMLHVPRTAEAREDRELRYAAMNGFAGDNLRGMLGIAAGLGPFNAFADMLGFAEPRVAHDFFGELANLTLGHVARAWCAQGVDITLGTPLVVPGVVFDVEGCDAVDRFDVGLDRPSGRIVAWIDVDVAPGFTFAGVGSDEVPSGGDLLMF